MMSENGSKVSAGTQVVVNCDIRSAGDVSVHARGAVGIVARTPAGPEEHYLVRLPDGFEVSLAREQFEILRHFKGQTPAKGGAPAFDLERTVIYRCVVGSRAYGLETEASDTDLRGIYLAPPEMNWSLFGAPEQFEDNGAQSCYWELQKFLVMALKANPNVLECLYSTFVEKVTPLGQELLAIRERFLSQMVFQTFNGYALSQFKKIEQDRRNRGEIRWKHAMHLVRLLLTGAATLRERQVPLKLEGHRDRLLAIKRGEVSWSEVDAWRRELHSDFEQALKETSLPERPDYGAVNVFLVKSRRSQIR